MANWDSIAEEKIRSALRAGEFDNLPGAGKPLHIEIDPLVPEEDRVALLLLKNSGYTPFEIAQLRETTELEAAIQAARAQGRLQHAAKLIAKLAVLREVLAARQRGAK
jgi:hypothetical protein